MKAEALRLAVAQAREGRILAAALDGGSRAWCRWRKREEPIHHQTAFTATGMR